MQYFCDLYSISDSKREWCKYKDFKTRVLIIYLFVTLKNFYDLYNLSGKKFQFISICSKHKWIRKYSFHFEIEVFLSVSFVFIFSYFNEEINLLSNLPLLFIFCKCISTKKYKEKIPETEVVSFLEIHKNFFSLSSSSISIFIK